MLVVSEPASASVTENACRRSSPLAIRGRYSRFCASLPCRSSAPIVYICAWQAAAEPPERLISSSTMLASATPSPSPPYWGGISAASRPEAVSASTNACGYSRAASRARQ